MQFPLTHAAIIRDTRCTNVPAQRRWVGRHPYGATGFAMLLPRPMAPARRDEL